MKWLFVSNMFPSRNDPSYGVFVSRSLCDLRSQGIAISQVVTIEGRNQGLKKLYIYFNYFCRLLYAGIFSNVQAIYAHYASHHCIPIAILVLIFRKKLVLHIHGDDLSVRRGFFRTLNRIGQHFLVRHASLIVVPSHFFFELLMSIYASVDSRKIFISPSSGVECASFKRCADDRSPHWNNEHHGTATAHFGFVGRIDEDKGWRVVIDAYAMLPENIINRIHLHFWGIGSDVDKLLSAISNIGAGNITYHGHVEPKQVPVIHRDFDFHLVPSYRESLGLSAIEGLAAGHILICSSIRPFIDFTEDGKNALHFIVGSSESLSITIIRALNMPVCDLRKISNASRIVALNYDRVVVSKLLYDAIEDKVLRQ